VLRVFLCHATGDKPAVRKLYQRLCAEGIDAWLDEEKLLPGQDWRLEIPKAVRESDAVIVCLSRGSITKAGYVQPIFDAPLGPHQAQQSLWIGFIGREAGDPINDFLGDLAVLDPLQTTFEFEHLLHIWPVQILSPFATGGERALLQPSVRFFNGVRRANLWGGPR